jgi:pilus assembly protein Flp/PilA
VGTLISAIVVWFTSRTRSDRGASLVEYAMLLALIAVVCIGALSFFGGGNAGSIDTSANSIITAN